MSLLPPSRFWRDVSPRTAWADLRTVIDQAGPNKWWIGLMSAASTIGIFSIMWGEGAGGLPRPPEVTYIRSWPADRSEAEIIASNIANQKRKDRLAAEQARRDEDVRQIYKTIGRYSGMDVDKIEQKAIAERKAGEAAYAAGQAHPVVLDQHD